MSEPNPGPEGDSDEPRRPGWLDGDGGHDGQRASVGRSEKVSERLARRLANDIVSSRLVPGTRLPNEAALAASFGVGRGSVREAMRLLELNGLIELRTGAHGGPVVSRPTTSDLGRTLSLYLQATGATLRDLTETRLALEPWMAGLAAEHRVEGAEAALREVIDLDESQIADDETWLRMGVRFHDVVVALSGRPMLDAFALALMKIHSDRVHGHMLDADMRTRLGVHAVHRGIAEAILAGDAETAERAMREHLQANFERLVALNPSLLDKPVEWW